MSAASASWRSYLLVAVLALGVLFSLFYVASQSAKPGHAHSTIPTEPKVAQIEVVGIIENDLRAEVPEVQEAKLMFQLYNFSAQKYESGDSQYSDYIRKIGYGWSFSHIKKYPEPLALRLEFVHANGTVYAVNATSHSFEKICDEHSLTCPSGVAGTLAAKDRLVYRALILREPYYEDTYIVDAESGKMVWNSIDYEKNRKPMPNVNFDNKTIVQLFRERLDPPETMQATIVRGASDPDYNQNYLPEEIRVTLSIDNRIVWTNMDVTAHTVVSDNSYANSYTGKFESEMIAPNSTFQYTFFETGYYPYHCEIHPHMKGAVDVIENFS